MAIVIKAPDRYERFKKMKKIFLAGSIEMGVAKDWQSGAGKFFDGIDVLILNPRREEWDSSWKQSIRNPKLREQIEWELVAQERSDVIIMYFDPNTKSPITLLELGLSCNINKKLAVCCPKGFWRKANVDMVCRRYGVPQLKTVEELMGWARDVVFCHGDSK